VFTILRLCSTAHARRKVAQHGVGFTVNFPCQFTSSTSVGNYCHFNGIKVRGIGRLTIGDYFHSGEDILVITQNHNYRNPRLLPYDAHDIGRDVTIGAYVWLGSRVILLPGAELGDGCVVQAGAVVGGKFPANAVVGGNPATVLRFRDAEVVARLVAQGRFLL
jgi:acetyltransferase-like isoleucine patch superfamily enzyme